MRNEPGLEDWLTLSQLMRVIQEKRGCDSWMAIDLTMAQLKVSLIVSRSGGLSSSSIAEQLKISPSAVTPLVDRLVELKLAKREANDADRRVVYVVPTAKGTALRDSLLQSNRALLAEVLEEVPQADREVVRRALASLRESAGRIDARARELVSAE